MQSTDLTTPLGMSMPFALNGDKNIPSATATGTDTSSLNDGFLPITQEPLDAGGVAPERIDFNGMFYLSTDLRCFLQNGGVITFDSAVNSAIGGYPKNAILGYIDNTGRFGFVRSLIEDNQYNFVSDPSKIDGVNWEYVNLLNFNLLTPQFTNLQNAINTLDSSVVKLTGNQTVAGNKTFTGTVKVNNSTTAGTALSLAKRGTNFIQLGDGTAMQWGSGNTGSGNDKVTITMSYAMPSTSYRVFLTDSGSDPDALSYQKIYEIVNKQTFRVSSSDNGDAFYWFAIGR